MPVAGCLDCRCRGASGGGGGGISHPEPVFVGGLGGGVYGTGRPGSIGGRFHGESPQWCGHLVVLAVRRPVLAAVWYWWRLMSVEGAVGGSGIPDRHGVGRVFGSAGGGRCVASMHWVERYA